MDVSPKDLLPVPERSVLLVVDIQERLVPAMPPEEAGQVIRSASILIETAKLFDLPVTVSEQYPKGLGATLDSLRACLPETARIIPKLSFSCWGEAAFAPVWAEWAGKDILLCGIEAHVCVLQTGLDLLEQGFRVFLAADAVCSRSPHNKQLALDLLRQAGAVVGSTEIFAFGLQRQAGTERFKKISRLVK